ncbi:MAG: GNAT family N-acetyltransferase [Caulobacteraceae bacterium]
MSVPWPPEVELVGRHARLVPLAATHATSLSAAVKDGELWKLWFTAVPAPDDMVSDIERRLALRAAGSSLPFAVVDQITDEAVGMTSYLNIDAINRRLEIGSTWYRRCAQRTAINTECKRLLLGHAFEDLACIAVEFRTHFSNSESRRAIERLGAKMDGILRSHTRMRDGSLRDTCVYSILAAEWPTVRGNLDARLERGSTPSPTPP